MTIEEAERKVLAYLKSCDVFALHEDLNALIPMGGGEKEKKVVRVALAMLEETKVVCRCGNEDVWALRQDLSSYPQTIRMSGVTAKTFADLLNAAFEGMGDKTNPVDPLQIREFDIKRVCWLLETLVAHPQPDEIADNKRIGF